MDATTYINSNYNVRYIAADNTEVTADQMLRMTYILMNIPP